MSIEGLTGKVQTVLGRIEPEDLRITLPHEHILCDYTVNIIEPTEATEKALFHQPVTPDIRWWLRYAMGASLDNQRLDNEKLAVEEVLRFKIAEGDSIVELTVANRGRDPLALAHLSRATGLNIIMGSGYYRGGSEMDAKSEEEITEEIVRDITEGAGSIGIHRIRAGVIGEIGYFWPLTKNDIKLLRASARAQQLTGAPLIICTGCHGDALPEIIRILDKASADLSRTYISHVDMCVRDIKKQSQLAKTGCYVGYDLFGKGEYYKRASAIKEPLSAFKDPPNDHQRIKEIAQLIGEGHLDQILVSHDIANKVDLCAYGGPGYAHILRDVVPVMRSKGFSEEVIHAIMVDNPKRLLTFV